MSNNLFVSFQLGDSRRSSALILAAVEELGHSLSLCRSLWYVRSNLSAAEAAVRVREVLHEGDRLLVVDATHDEIAMMNIEERASAIVDVQWHREIPTPASGRKFGCGVSLPLARASVREIAALPFAE